ncbi:MULTISPECIES: C40 family peptidase [unclassified Arthrobacter]|uniref:C40 family peptidase n=1 Tax=unclassified Arthrobacter TaxID=235627 RepID=UPI002DF9EB32|nr:MULTISPECIES: NlpC/P60 family protein [unclassified Arthrobacter]MEC5192942.1 cell wall-associated NlpC family hydrolase [Arthrobacter sp. MP_M4]MEC5204471.1 cell wall-associated NlpC family hydrolase [Arthrobacter sp. MP_M7]
MSMTEAIGRMQGIQAMIAELSRPAAAQTNTAALQSAAATSLATGTGSGDAGSFTEALTAALGGTKGTDASSLATSLGMGGTTAVGALKGVTQPATVPATVPAAGAATGTDVVAMAKKYIGVPYVWGGTNPATGMDCSGFTQRVFKDLGVEIPRVVSDQMRQGTPVASLAEAKPGDLLVSFGGDHISIYLGNGKAIDAPVPGKTIQIRAAWEQYSNLTSIRRIVPAGTA